MEAIWLALIALWLIDKPMQLDSCILEVSESSSGIGSLLALDLATYSYKAEVQGYSLRHSTVRLP